jgi:hypothetical protein
MIQQICVCGSLATSLVVFGGYFIWDRCGRCCGVEPVECGRFGRKAATCGYLCVGGLPPTQNSRRSEKARMSCSHCKTMRVCFFNLKGIVHSEFIAQGQTVNQQCYLQVLTRLWESVRRKRTELWPDK